MDKKLVLITGGSASGKSTLAHQLKERLGERCVLLSQDSFYKSTGDPNNNYDVPSAFDFSKQFEALNTLLEQGSTTAEIPVYDFTKHKSVGTEKIESADIIVFEGLFTFFDKDTFKKADFKIFVDTPADTRLARRIKRDVLERGRKMEDVIDRWEHQVQPSYIDYINTMKYKADIIIPWNTIKEKAVDALIVTFGGDTLF